MKRKRDRKIMKNENKISKDEQRRIRCINPGCYGKTWSYYNSSLSNKQWSYRCEKCGMELDGFEDSDSATNAWLSVLNFQNGNGKMNKSEWKKKASLFLKGIADDFEVINNKEDLAVRLQEVLCMDFEED